MLFIVMLFFHLNIFLFKKLIRLRYLSIALYILFLSNAYSQEQVDIKGFETDLFSRLVFNWESPVEYQATIIGKEVTIKFSRPGVIEAQKIRGFLPKIINSSSYDSVKNEVKINLIEESEIQTTVNGSSIIFEIQRVKNIDNVSESTVPKINKGILTLNNNSDIRVRVGKHEKYSRVVFDWKNKVNYEVVKDLDVVNVKFNIGKKIIIPENLRNFPHIFSISQEVKNDQNLVKIKTSEMIEVKHFVNNDSVVIDFIHNDSLVDKKNNSSKKVNSNNVKKISEDKNLLEKKPIEKNNKNFKNKKSENIPLKVDDKKVKPLKADDKKENSFSIEKPGKLKVSFIKNDNGLSALFKWENPTSAAVFERAGYNWVLFGGTGPFEISNIGKEFSKDLISIEPIKIMRGLAFRVKVRDDLYPNVTRRGSTWKIDFKSQKNDLSRPLLARRQPNWPTGPRVFIPLEGATPRIAIPDPEVGDDLAVIPIVQDGRGREKDRTFAQFKLLASSQGVVVERWSDDIRVATANYGVEISAPNIGLVLSNSKKEKINNNEEIEDDELLQDISSILDFVKWRGETTLENFDQVKRDLQLLASNVNDDEKVEAYLDIARLFISFGLSAETLGFLKIAYDVDPSIEESLEFKAIRGAASYLMGRIDEAAKDLLESEYGVDPSVSIWRGAVLAAQRNWQDARQEFQLGVIALSDLTPELRVKFQLIAAETAYNSGEIASAEDELKSIDSEEASQENLSRGKLIIGLARLASGDKTGGLDILNDVVNENYRPTWAEAQVVYTVEKYKLGQLDIKDAIDNLESLLFVWRGGEFELSLLKKLKDLYLEDQDYRGAMNSLRTIKTAFNGTNDSNKADKDLNDLFLKLYLDGESEKMSPVKALALYNEFSELTPDGEIGDEIINKLSDRLVSVDLLDQAAQLLNYQVSFRLKGIEKGRVASRLAAVYLFDRQTEKCIKVLNDSKFNLLPEDLKLERLFLRARAHLLEEDYEKVLELLKNNNQKESFIIRAEVYWKNKNWLKTVSELDKALNLRWQSSEPLSVEERNQVIQMTVSLALLDDWDNLILIRERWLNLMRSSEDAEPFDILTLNPDTESLDFRKVAGRIAQIDTLNAFMKRYNKN